MKTISCILSTSYVLFYFNSPAGKEGVKVVVAVDVVAEEVVAVAVAVEAVVVAVTAVAVEVVAVVVLREIHYLSG